MQDKPKRGAREKVLQAAEELAVEVGPGNLSLDAVAARAGVSKGGLLYHFPSKGKLLEALVESFVCQFEAELTARIEKAGGEPIKAATAYLDMFVEEHLTKRPPAAGLLTAMAENPEFMRPVRKHQRTLLDRIKECAADPTAGMIVFLALQGIKSQELLSLETLDSTEFGETMARLREMLVH